MPHTIYDEIRAQLDANGIVVLPSTTDHVIINPSDPSPDGSVSERPTRDVHRDLLAWMTDEMSKAVLGESMVGEAKRSGEK